MNEKVREKLELVESFKHVFLIIFIASSLRIFSIYMRKQFLVFLHYHGYIELDGNGIAQ